MDAGSDEFGLFLLGESIENDCPISIKGVYVFNANEKITENVIVMTLKNNGQFLEISDL